MGNIFESIKQLDKVKVSKFLPDEKLIEEAEQMEDSTQREHTKKMIYLKDLNKALEDAKEVHSMFLEMLEM